MGSDEKGSGQGKGWSCGPGRRVEGWLQWGVHKTGSKEQGGARLGIKRWDQSKIEKSGPGGGVEQSGAGEDSSWNGSIIVVAWGILELDRQGSDREWNATCVAQGASLCRDETKGKCVSHWEQQRRSGWILNRAAVGEASMRCYQLALLSCNLKQG